MKTIYDYPIDIKFELPPILESKERCAIDTEFFQMDGDRLHRPVKLDGTPNGIFACATFCFDGRTVYFVTDEKDVQQAMDNVADAVWIFANMKFDITHLKRYANIPPRTTKVWDVLNVDHIMYSGYYTAFTLADLVRRRLHCYLPKDDRKLFETGTELTQDHIKYAAYDPLATWHVYMHQRTEVAKSNKKALNVWKDVDLKGINAVLSMSGFLLDKDAWMELYYEALARRQELQDVKYPDINLNSTTHQVAPLIVEHGFDLPKTPTGKYSASLTNLRKIEEPNEFVLDMIEYGELKTRATTYGENFILNGLEADGRLHADFIVSGPETGRMASRKPNMQNIPNIKTDARYRRCLIAGKGNVLIVGDWSSQEPRTYAYLTQDGKMIEIFNSGLDIYIESARLMYGWELTHDDPRRSKPMKPTVLGACYNLTGYGMEKEYGIPADEGQAHIDAFFDVFTVAKAWNEAQQKKTGYVETILGRRFWLNPYDWKSQNNAINMPVQGSAGDAMKQASWLFCEKWRATENSPILDFVHDELVLEVAESARDSAIECLRECMIEVAEAMHPGVKAQADIGWGYNWADAKV